MKAIEVKNLSFAYEEGKYVLDKVSFSLEKGTSLAIVGKNGSGKSTLARILTGLLSFKDGEVLINGTSPTEKDFLSKASISIVFQNPDNQFIAATVRDDIAFGLENSLVPHEEMDALIEKYATMVGMKDYLDRAPENLSGGQKQRVAIAGVLALNSDIIIFDEATSMLDPQGKADFNKTIKNLKEENPNLTIIAITHNEEEVFDYDRILVLDHGKVVMDGTSEEIYKEREKYKSYGLNLPFLYEFEDTLNKNGFSVGHSNSIDEIVRKLK